MTSTDLVPATDRLPWEKRPAESFKAFQAFAVYRDLGPTRSIPKVAEACHKSDSLIKGWCRKHDWVERCELYDLETDRRHREARQTEIEKFRREEIQVGYALQQPALLRLKGRGAEGETDYVPALDPKDLDAGDIATFLREGDRLTRLGFGMPTDFTKGMDSWSGPEVIKLVQRVVDALLELVPDDRQHEGLLRVQGVFETWGQR